jgi:hypothetical protein
MTCEWLTEWSKRGAKGSESMHAYSYISRCLFVCDADDEKINCGSG